MTIRLPSIFAALALAALAGCHQRHDAGPIEVGVIGPAIGSVRAAPDRGPIDAPAAALTNAGS